LIVGGEHASLVVRDSEVLDNYDHGIAAMSGATVVVEGCTVSRNAANGIWLAGSTPASRVEGNSLEGNGGTGVFVESCSGRIAGNRISGNGVGIAVIGFSAPAIEGNHLAGNGIGLGVRGSDAAPRVAGNTITDSRRDGIVIDQQATGRFESNTVTGSDRAGVWVSDKGSGPRFSGNHVGGGAVGILATGGGGGEFRSNDLRGNRDGSWHLDEPGPLAREDNLEDSGRALAEGVDPDADAPAGSNPPTLMN
jgi:parallel beta-helix repeat protein